MWIMELAFAYYFIAFTNLGKRNFVLFYYFVINDMA